MHDAMITFYREDVAQQNLTEDGSEVVLGRLELAGEGRGMSHEGFTR